MPEIGRVRDPVDGPAVADLRRSRSDHPGHGVPGDDSAAGAARAGRAGAVMYEIGVRGGGPRFVVRVADGAAEVRAAGDPVDCVISAAPAAFLLVGYGRLPIGRALLRGGALAWGRRRWLGLRFNDHLFSP
jgi:SCP-2 sterol transfer family